MFVNGRVAISCTLITILMYASGCGSGARHTATQSGEELARKYRTATARIEAFGKMAGPSESAAVRDAIGRYFTLLSVEDYSGVCRMVAKGTSEDVLHKSCKEKLAIIFKSALLGGVNKRLRSNIVREVRIQGTGGYVLISSSAARNNEGFIAVRREAGRWRPAALVPSAMRVEVG